MYLSVGLIRHRLNPASDLCLLGLLILMSLHNSTASLALHEDLGQKVIFLVNECESASVKPKR